jgi:hypothetical protein
VKVTGIQERPVAVKKDSSVFKQGRQATSMPVTRLEKPKPVIRDDRRGKSESSGSREGIHVQPKVAPKEPDRKPVEQPAIKERRSDQKPVEGRPVITPREGSGRGKIQTRETEKPAVVQPSVKERPGSVPGERTQVPAVKERGTERPEKQKEIKNAPSVPPKGEVKNLPKRPGEVKNLGTNKNQKGSQDKQIPDPRSQGN